MLPLLTFFFLLSSEDDEDIPLSKRAKLLNEKAESAKE
jgi:hypothetical protein